MTSLRRTRESVDHRTQAMRYLVRAEAAESARFAEGVESSLIEMIEAWIEMAWQDGSFGWPGIANLPSSFAAASYLPDEGRAKTANLCRDPRAARGRAPIRTDQRSRRWWTIIDPRPASIPTRTGTDR
jgi:hypothetical protein